MKVKTTLIALILLLCLVCNAFFPLLSLPSTPNAHTALAFKPTPTNKNTNNNNTDPISKPPVVVNHPLVANAGQNQTVNAGYVVSLDGSGSRDPDGSIASYSWKQTAGPAVTLNGADTATAQFVAPSS